MADESDGSDDDKNLIKLSSDEDTRKRDRQLAGIEDIDSSSSLSDCESYYQLQQSSKIVTTVRSTVFFSSTRNCTI